MYCGRCGAWVPDDAAACGRCGTPRATAPATVAPAAPFAAAPAGAPAWTAAYGGFWRRFAGLLVDALLLWFPSATLRALLGVPIVYTHPLEESPAGVTALLVLFDLLVPWLYCALLESSARQGTLGQQLLDLRVTDLNGRRISFARATGRHFANLLNWLTLLVGYLIQPFTARRQTLHDMVSGTLVVRAGGAPAAAAHPTQAIP